MTIRLKRFDPSVSIPEYKTPGAAAMDVSARIDVTILPKQVGKIPLNFALDLPDGYFSLIAPRSSTHKLGLMSGNSIGIIDSDYRGDNDEYIFLAYNFTDNPVTIEKGTRVAQMLILPVSRVRFEEVATLDTPDRGGFGTTGHH
ncbi:MAG TPA: dUTP diphosphatase [Patescibacteria group bacterium]